ncbi:MAG: hypothetical protein ABIK89_01545, partial [Planctomycetota bacterium]
MKRRDSVGLQVRYALAGLKRRDDLAGSPAKVVAVCFFLMSPLSTPSSADEPAKPAYEPTSNYTPRDVRGWTVFVNHRLLEDQKELGDRTL